MASSFHMRLKRSHERADFRKETTMAQAQHRRLGMPPMQAGPVPRGFSVPLHEPSAPLSPDVEFHDPVRTSDCAVEQEMLDHGILTGEDLDLMVHGSELPNLGPNFHSPEALLACEAGARPLTAYTAHHLLPDPEQHAAARQLEKMLEEVRNQQEQADDNVIEEELLDADAEFEDLQGYEDPGDAELEDVLVTTGHTNEDDPDPFITDNLFSSSLDTDLSHVPPHLLTIYALVTWLHLQFHLPRAACNALLAVLACLLLAISPSIETPFITLQSSNRVLGVDAPILTLPIKSMLKIPGLEAILDDWRSKPRSVGTYTDIFDGDMCRKKLKDPDGKLFFSNSPGSRISGVTSPHLIHHVRLHFQYVISPQSTGTGLQTFYARASCLDLKEQNPDQIQRFLRPIVSDLLRLWKNGIKVPTESCPEGRLVRVILVAVINLAHSNKEVDTQITNFQFTAELLLAFKSRTNDQQRKLGETYRHLVTSAARKNFVKENATRYTQLARLPYFDLVEQIVIDPMHNLFLGLVKTHFYNIWVQNKILRPNHELTKFHEMIADFIIPSSCGKLPTDIGMPSGGSLTADQWLLLSTVYGPIIIPQLWSTCLPVDASGEVLNQRLDVIQRLETQKQVAASHKADNRKSLAKAKKQGTDAYALEKARIAQENLALAEAKKTAKLKAAAAKEAEKLRLATEKKARAALKKVLGKHKATSQTVEDSPEGEVHQPPPPPPPQFNQQDAGDDSENLDDLKFSLHPDDPDNFLKLCSALRILVRRVICDVDINEADRLLREYTTGLIKLYGSAAIKPNHHYATHIADCVRNFGPLHDFWTFLFERLNKVLKSFKTNNRADGELETTFFREFQRTCQTSRLSTACGDEPLVQNSTPLNREATFYDYVIVNGRRFHASRTVGSNSSSLVHVTIPGATPGTAYYGELLEIFQFELRSGDSVWFGRMRWFKPWHGTSSKVWDDL
ncbi:hypothetical protein DFH29DRAFT_881751 [Suillus ampliporus]|nr:hypothetical protein DFH29DRAFT_881751 [Suillus ampliporus]